MKTRWGGGNRRDPGCGVPAEMKKTIEKWTVDAMVIKEPEGGCLMTEGEEGKGAGEQGDRRSHKRIIKKGGFTKKRTGCSKNEFQKKEEGRRIRKVANQARMGEQGIMEGLREQKYKKQASRQRSKNLRK